MKMLLLCMAISTVAPLLAYASSPGTVLKATRIPGVTCRWYEEGTYYVESIPRLTLGDCHNNSQVRSLDFFNTVNLGAKAYRKESAVNQHYQLQQGSPVPNTAYQVKKIVFDRSHDGAVVTITDHTGKLITFHVGNERTDIICNTFSVVRFNGSTGIELGQCMNRNPHRSELDFIQQYSKAKPFILQAGANLLPLKTTVKQIIIDEQKSGAYVRLNNGQAFAVDKNHFAAYKPCNGSNSNGSNGNESNRKNTSDIGTTTYNNTPSPVLVLHYANNQKEQQAKRCILEPYAANTLFLSSTKLKLPDHQHVDKGEPEDAGIYVINFIDEYGYFITEAGLPYDFAVGKNPADVGRKICADDYFNFSYQGSYAGFGHRWRLLATNNPVANNYGECLENFDKYSTSNETLYLVHADL